MIDIDKQKIGRDTFEQVKIREGEKDWDSNEG